MILKQILKQVQDDIFGSEISSGFLLQGFDNGSGCSRTNTSLLFTASEVFNKPGDYTGYLPGCS
jgi:hypothetical protein